MVAFTLIVVTDGADADEERAIAAADEFAEAIRYLVGDDGDVRVETVQAEFDRIVWVSPHRPDAVAFEVMILGKDLVVVFAHEPQLGWWTFDGDSPIAESWAVIRWLVEVGGRVVREKKPKLIRPGVVRLGDADSDRSWLLEDGGAGPRRRISDVSSYRTPPRLDKGMS